MLALAAITFGRVWHPKVGGARVEVNDELLVVGTDGDGTRPLGVVLLVRKGLALTLGEMLWEDDSGLDLCTRVESFPAAVSFEVDQVLAVLAVTDRYKLVYLPQSGMYSLNRLVRLNQGLVMVKGTVGLSQGAALGESNTNTLLSGYGSCGCEECKSDGKQAGFAEHGSGQCKLLGRRGG